MKELFEIHKNQKEVITRSCFFFFCGVVFSPFSCSFGRFAPPLNGTSFASCAQLLQQKPELAPGLVSHEAQRFETWDRLKQWDRLAQKKASKAQFLGIFFIPLLVWSSVFR